MEFFTYQISTPAHIIISGPYQFLVHPGYSGAFIHMSAFIMLLTTPLNQRGKLTYLKVPITILLIAALSKMFLQRIEDEEILLSEHFGEQWTAHLNDKWRLFPYIYWWKSTNQSENMHKESQRNTAHDERRKYCQ